MSQIIESRFRVFEFDKNDVLLNDIADAGLPVHVNKAREEYDDSLQSKIDDLEPGNVIEAEIQSESVTQQDDIWKFIDVEVVSKTTFHFLEDADNYSSHVDELINKANNKGEEGARTTISSDGDPIGFITVSKDKGDKFWRGLQSGLNTHEVDLENLEAMGEPPFEAIYTRTSNRELMIFYHFVERGTKPAQAVLSAN